MSYVAPIRLFGPCAVLTMALLAGCLGAPEAETEVDVAEALAFEDVGWGDRGTLDTTEIAIRDAATWAGYQAALRPNRPPFKTVDFAQEMVLLAALPVPSGGYSIRFEIVERTDAGLTARYRLSVPAPDCRPTMGESLVFQAVRIARSDVPLHFERLQEAYRCTER